jgi:TetR/AcrR family transcriptional repressor of mexJK operon
MTVALSARSLRKREAILSAGQHLFLAHGYKGTSVDQIAAAAEVSKQTVYKHFNDKRELLFAIVTDVLDQAAEPFSKQLVALADTEELQTDLIALAVAYLRSVLHESVVQLRRLVVGEAGAVPELAALYYDRAPAETLRALGGTFGHLTDRGLLRAHDPHLAAEHFAFLVVGKSIDKALFFGSAETLADLDIGAHARAGVNVFLGAYGSPGTPPGP